MAYKKFRAPRVPRDHREPVDHHLLCKQLELDQQANTTRIYLLVDEQGCDLVAQGVLPGYLVEQARQAKEWYCIEERKPLHERNRLQRRIQSLEP